MKVCYFVFIGTAIGITFVLCLSLENNGTFYFTSGSNFKGFRKSSTNVSRNSKEIKVSSTLETTTTTTTATTTTTRASSTTDQFPEAMLTHIIQKLHEQSNKKTPNGSNNLKESVNNKTGAVALLRQMYPTVQKQRINKIKTVCRDTDLFRDLMYKGKNNTRYYYSKTYGFSYCKVPKSGSTFWMQAFYILENEDENSVTVFSKARSRVHGLTWKFTLKFDSQQRKNSLSVIVSRDPFSRLFSAFIDKSYQCLDKSLNKNIMQFRPALKRHNCPDDVTFQEFLDFIINEVGREQTLNRHWAPIYNLCRPCDVNAYILVKQESFSKDVEQALKAFSVPDEKLATILSALHEHRIETTIPGIVQTVMNKNKITKKGTCVYGQKLIQRIWTAFKIQGYLKETIEFPSKLFNSKLQYDDTSYVTEVILASINRNKMTSSEMKRRRHKALVDAYKQIRNETLTQIIEIYKFDFTMFNYSTITPH
ncbi:carbohydrate sulfotransferase 10-like isoform X2 [Ruditapes philippinarum]|uniref:carbohydrate sulfotransferase 10-like isoform X2 n=1 Tax=Ruditapes philippinarum TaxID=129788 RepID=UPI00295AC138|nr:carbohydrate sulfotransferase 10-like isoform X2 [Ruditapes philippinarum]